MPGEHPYRSPATPEAQVPAPPHTRVTKKLAAVIGVLPLLLFGGCISSAKSNDDALSSLVWLLPLLWFTSILLCFALAGSQFLRDQPASSRWAKIGLLLVGPLVSLGLIAHAIANFNYSKGRQLVRRGRQRLPTLNETEATRSSWPPQAIDGWLHNARAEIASVAAFNHLANELLAIGAPAFLIEGALRASLEEIEHAKACFALVGQPWSMREFPSATWPADRPASVQSLAEDCLRDACVLEHASAEVAARLAAHKNLPEAIATVLRTIAREEASHAEHGWQILEYLCEREPTLSRPLLLALDRLEQTPPTVHGSEHLADYGLASAELWRHAVAEALQQTRRRLETQLTPSAQAA